MLKNKKVEFVASARLSYKELGNGRVEVYGSNGSLTLEPHKEIEYIDRNGTMRSGTLTGLLSLDNEVAIETDSDDGYKLRDMQFLAVES